ncbi:MAG: hypothetical protein LBL76_11215 [Treponema sp.]|jgi:hypothetical protein|nr:hypothetical protein [Treponema sp.]
MLTLTSTQKEIINHLIAAHEQRPWNSQIATYFRAFTGAFHADMPFTFYFLAVNHPIMYVYDPRVPDKRSSREVFHRECHEKKQKILEITDFFEYLTEKDYVHRIYQGLAGRPVLPNQYDKTWRKYSDFYNDIMTGLSFVCLSDFKPNPKLYELS